MPRKSTTEDLKKLLKRKPAKTLSPTDLLSTGSTLLNLACSGNYKGGFYAGHYYFLVGDSMSGKTWLSLTCMAEATLNPRFKSHKLILDQPEVGGASMDIERYFGKQVDDSLVTRRSETVENFYSALTKDLKEGPCIAVLDSMDALETQEDQARRNGKGEKGSYGTAKAKLNSANIRLLPRLLSETGSILIVISQTRDNIGFGAQFNPKTRSGGKALRFYAELEMWSSVKGKIKRTIKGKPRRLGNLVQVEVKKNRHTGQEHSVDIPIYWSHGIDDTGSMIQWLQDEGHWEESKGVIKAPEFKFNGREEDLVQKIIKGGLEDELKLIVSETWQEIESACQVQRPKRYE